MVSRVVLLLAVASAPLTAGSGSAPEPARSRAELRAEAEAILDDVQNLDITAAEARRRVELLLKDLRAWAEASGVELSEHSHTYSSSARQEEEGLTADGCPIFFKEDIEEEDDVCPLDLSRSEVWGARVLFCRYFCAPEPKPERE